VHIKSLLLKIVAYSRSLGLQDPVQKNPKRNDETPHASAAAIAGLAVKDNSTASFRP